MSRPIPVERLSFVCASPKRKGKKRNFWNVRNSSDYGDDCARGDTLALEYLAYAAASDSPTMLALIVADMPRKLGGCEIGFLSVVAEAAVSGRERAVELVSFWDDARSKGGRANV